MTLKKSSMGNEFKNRWDKFRDALRHEDQLIFDEMFKAPVIHSEAIAVGEGNEFEKQFMAMMIEKRKLDSQFEQQIDEIRKRIETLESRED